MPINRLMALLIATTVVMPTLGQADHANLLIKVDKSTQRMTVAVNGNQLYDWPVSTGGGGYDTPNGRSATTTTKTMKPAGMTIGGTNHRAITGSPRK